MVAYDRYYETSRASVFDGLDGLNDSKNKKKSTHNNHLHPLIKKRYPKSTPVHYYLLTSFFSRLTGLLGYLDRRASPKRLNQWGIFTDRRLERSTVVTFYFSNKKQRSRTTQTRSQSQPQPQATNPKLKKLKKPVPSHIHNRNFHLLLTYFQPQASPTQTPW